jgi:CelD/BcsL family acetyltransferase involved in cellulose biosynthesis
MVRITLPELPPMTDSKISNSLIEQHSKVETLQSAEAIAEPTVEKTLEELSHLLQEGLADSVTQSERLEKTGELNQKSDQQFRLHVIDADAGFVELESCWNRLATSPMRSFSWHYHWWQAFAEKSKLRIYALQHQGETVAIAPLFEDRWLGMSRLRFLGSGKTCTDYPDLIVAPELRGQFEDHLFRLLDSSPVDVIELEGVDDRGPVATFNSRLENSFWHYEKLIDACWFLDLPATWDEFLKNSSGSLRRKIRKAEKRLASNEVVMRSTSDDLDFDNAFDILVSLHQSRFEAKGEPGVFADPSFKEFLRAAVGSLCLEELVEINVSYVVDEPLAAQLYLLSETGPQFYQGGMRTDRI